MMPNLPLSVFNPVFFHLQEAIKDPDIFTIILMGGRGSGKSYSVAQTLPIHMINTSSDVLALRFKGKDAVDKIGKQILKSSRIYKKIIPGLRLPQAIPQKAPFNISFKHNKLTVDGSDNNNEDSVKGLDSTSIVCLDESDQFSLQYKEQIDSSLRGLPNQKEIMAFNPVSIRSWVKKKLVDNYSWIDQPNFVNSKNATIKKLSHLTEFSFVKKSTCGTAIYIKTTYRDNFWVIGHPLGSRFGFHDVGYIERLEGLKVTNPNNHNIYSLGEWGTPSEGLVFDPKKWSIIEDVPKEATYLGTALDFGFSSSECACYDFYKFSGALVWDELIYKKGLANVQPKDSDEVPTVQKELEKNKFDKNNVIVADSADPQGISDLRTVGYYVVGVNKLNKRLSSIKLLKSMKHLITKRSKGAISEFETLEHSKDKFGEYTDEVVKAGDHAFDCGRYIMIVKDRL